MPNRFTEAQYDTPRDVRVKNYKKGFAIELLYGNKWINLHSLVYDFPEEYYFPDKTVQDRKSVEALRDYIKYLIKKSNAIKN